MKTNRLAIGGLVAFGAAVYLLGFSDAFATVYDAAEQKAAQVAQEAKEAIAEVGGPAMLDKDEYNERMLALAHINLASTTEDAVRAATGTPKLLLRSATEEMSVRVAGEKGPRATVYPAGGAILPFKRIIAYYGNFYSTQMGVLGEYAPETVLSKLTATAAAWQAADPSTPTIPAIHYIAVVAQGTATRNGKWIARMPDEEVDKALGMAAQINGLVFLDVQVGQSNLQAEIPMLEKYLSMPTVHLGIDPEFSMKHGERPGTVIGTFTAADVNWTIQYLAKLVREHNLPPKVLVIHRFTYDMVTNVSAIEPLPEVQVVMDMDGWGPPAKKLGTYTHIIIPEPVQFTGFKLFYKADLRPPSTRLLTMQEVLSQTPAPIYVQYQ